MHGSPQAKEKERRAEEERRVREQARRDQEQRTLDVARRARQEDVRAKRVAGGRRATGPEGSSTFEHEWTGRAQVESSRDAVFSPVSV